MLTLQLRPCYKIVYLGLKRRLLAETASQADDEWSLVTITPSMTGDTVTSHPRQSGGETTSGVLEDSTFDEATHSTAVDIQARTFRNPQRASRDTVSGTQNPTIRFFQALQGTFKNACAKLEWIVCRRRRRTM